MGKREELRLLRNSTSADAPINYHQRTGDSEGSGGSMLDLYTQVQSVEDDLLEEEDKAAQGVFIRAFKLFLKQTLTGKERKFLNAVMSGKGKPHEVGRAMKINWFDCMQEIQRKAFANAEAFKRVATLSGWSRAELFSAAVFKRLRDMGGQPIAEESREQKQRKARAMLAGFGQVSAEDRKTAARFEAKEYYKRHRTSILEYAYIYRKENKEKIAELHKKWREKQRGSGTPLHRRESEVKYRRSEKGKAVHIAAQKRWAEKNKSYQKEYRLAHREELKATHRAAQKRWVKRNKEKIKAYQKEYQKAYREKKKAEKLAAQALAGLMAISQAEATFAESSL